jgi:Leucine-rich repeat (LRR) protein
MSFDIETYLNSLPDDTKRINISGRNLTCLPDLSRFKELEILDCSYNQLTSLPPLNEKLECLICSFNQLSSLPPLSGKLENLESKNKISVVIELTT